MPDYLTLNAHELGAVHRLGEPDELRSVQLSRRDSLDNLHEDGFLIASVVERSGEQWRVAISKTGATTIWS